MPREKTENPKRAPRTGTDPGAADAWAAENAEAISERQTWIRTCGTPLEDLQVLRIEEDGGELG